MHIDFHTHGKLAKQLPLSFEYTDWILREAKEAGLDAICLTEHFNTQDFQELYRYIESKGRKDGDSYIWQNQIRIFPGMEIDIQEGGHILILGDMHSIIEINKKLEKNKDKNSFLSFGELIKLLSRYNLIIGAAHPFRKSSNIPSLPEKQLNNLDFIDLNGKDIAFDREKITQETENLARQLNIPVLGGSDTHQAVQFGCIKNKFEKECTNIAQLAEAIEGKRYEILIEKDTHLKVKSAGFIKKLLKDIHRLGGNYVDMIID